MRPTVPSTYRGPPAKVARAQPRAPGRADCARAPRPPRPFLNRDPPAGCRRLRRPSPGDADAQGGRKKGSWPISLRFTQPEGHPASPPQRFPRSQTPACAAVPPEPRKPCLNWPGTRLRPQRWRSHPEAIPKPLGGPPQHPSGEGTGPLSSASVPGPSFLRPPPSGAPPPSPSVDPPAPLRRKPPPETNGDQIFLANLGAVYADSTQSSGCGLAFAQVTKDGRETRVFTGA